MTIGNERARATAQARNTRPKRRTRREKDWLWAYRRRLLSHGLPLSQVVGIDPELDLAYDPESAADDELSYMADDARLFGE